MSYIGSWVESEVSCYIVFSHVRMLGYFLVRQGFSLQGKKKGPTGAIKRKNTVNIRSKLQLRVLLMIRYFFYLRWKFLILFFQVDPAAAREHSVIISELKLGMKIQY